MSSSLSPQRRISPSVASILKAVMIAVLAIGLILVVGVSVGGCDELECGGEILMNSTLPAPMNSDDPVLPTSSSSVATLSGEPSAMIVGKWHSVKYADTMEFTADGKYTMTPDAGSTDDPAAGTGTYKVKGWNLTITVSGGESVTIPFTIEGDTLTLRDEIPEVYSRVR